MKPPKPESNADKSDEEYIDVGGDDTPNFRGGPRRSKRQLESPRYVPYSRRTITRNVHLEDNETFEDIDEMEEEGSHQMGFSPEIQIEIDNDMALIQQERKRRFNNTENDQLLSDFGPVLFKFESTQRKKHVIVHNSLKFPDRASEWYHARINSSTLNETYRCVQCRRYREESKKGARKGVENLPEARIIVQNDRFMVNPDEPLGKHICDFENNDRTTLQSVWSRRALSKANSELRLRPEKPKEKFIQLLEEIQGGQEYAHLPLHVRLQIINELNSKKGFASKRRSFARNNRLGQQGSQNNYVYSDRQVMYSNEQVFLCGMEECDEKFSTIEERSQHRSFYHSNVVFIDTKEELDQYNQHNNNYVDGEELVVANEQVVLGDQMKNEAYEVVINDEEGGEFYSQSNYLLDSLRNSMINVVNDGNKRETMMNLIAQCERKCKELTGPNEINDETNGKE